MKARERYILTLAIGVLTSLQSGAATPDTGNPYSKIVVRNAFGLKDPPPVTEAKPETAPPPKITLQGTTKMLGRKQVLFKVALPAKPPQPAVDSSKILAEGERDGEIEVLEIDIEGGVIKFSNHGVVETKTMKDDAAKPTPGSIAMVPTPGGVPQPAQPGGAVMPQPSSAQGAGGSSVTSIGSSRAAGLQTIPTRNVRGGYGPPPTLGGTGQQGTGGMPNQTHEESVIKMELEREINKDAIASGKYPPPPPTVITPQPAPPAPQ